MRTVGISHKTRYWQHYCFSHPPAGYQYRRMADPPWHVLGIGDEFLANTKWFPPRPKADLYHTYNSIVVNDRPWVIEVESYLPRYLKMRPDHAVYRWALRRLAGGACKALVFTSRRTLEMNRDHLRNAGVDPAKMHVVYRAVEQYGPVQRDPDHFTIVFAGNGFYRKGGVELLRAFLQLDRPELRLWIISTLETDWGLCPMPEERAWAERTIAEDPRITLHRRLSHDQLIGLMRKADVFASTTYLDPFNNTVLEAMGCGLPVISSPTGALAEVVEHGTNGLLVEVEGRTSGGIAEELAQQLRRLMDDPELRRRMSAANDAIIKKHFCLDVRNAALAQLYDAALERA